MTEKHVTIRTPISTERRFYILSITHSTNDLLLWWRPDSCGYTTRLEDAGIYTETQVREQHLNERSTAAIQVQDAERLSRRVVSIDHLRMLLALSGPEDPDRRIAAWRK